MKTIILFFVLLFSYTFTNSHINNENITQNDSCIVLPVNFLTDCTSSFSFVDMYINHENIYNTEDAIYVSNEKSNMNHYSSFPITNKDGNTNCFRIIQKDICFSKTTVIILQNNIKQVKFIQNTDDGVLYVDNSTYFNVYIYQIKNKLGKT